jgi:hypothetical protein
MVLVRPQHRTFYSFPMTTHEPGNLLSDYFPREGESVEDRVTRWAQRDLQIGNIAEDRAVDHLIKENHRLKVEWKMPWRPAKRVVNQHLQELRLRTLAKRPDLDA